MNYLDMLEGGLSVLQSVARIMWYLLYLSPETSKGLRDLMKMQSLDEKRVYKVTSDFIKMVDPKEFSADNLQFFEKTLENFSQKYEI